MIPVRLPAAFVPHIVSVKHVKPDHLLADTPFDCPVCDESLSDRHVALVAVGIQPGDRKAAGGWTTGGAVAVHAECAGADSTSCTCRQTSPEPHPSVDDSERWFADDPNSPAEDGVA